MERRRYPRFAISERVRVLVSFAGHPPSLASIGNFSKSGMLPQAPDSFPVGYNPADPALAKGSGIACGLMLSWLALILNFRYSHSIEMS